MERDTFREFCVAVYEGVGVHRVRGLHAQAVDDACEAVVRDGHDPASLAELLALYPDADARWHAALALAWEEYRWWPHEDGDFRNFCGAVKAGEVEGLDPDTAQFCSWAWPAFSTVATFDDILAELVTRGAATL